MALTSPPQTETELMARANQIAGLSLGEIAEQYDIAVPTNLKRDKGWSGQLLEAVLGASANSSPMPDFHQLGIELKTIPVNRSGRPKESTYVCTVPLNQFVSEPWEQSWIYRKLQRVLWIPILVESKNRPESQTVGMPILWSPTSEENQSLKSDWEELMELIWLGKVDLITAHMGSVLQIRPKAANAKVISDTTSADGNRALTGPRGFYLRTQFTSQILMSRYFGF